MADESQNSNQGPAPQQPPQQQAPAPPQQPPPPPANAQEIIAAQQAALAQQIALAQQRDRAQFGPAAEGAAQAPVMGGVFTQASRAQGQPQPPASPPPSQGFNLPQGMNAQQVAQGIPSQGLMGIPNPAIAQQGGMQPPDFSRLPDPSVPQNGVTVQQLAAGAQVQGAPPPQYGQQQQRQVQPEQEAKPHVLWHPGRNSRLVIELDDAFLENLPDSIQQETDPQAKVVAVLLSEILSLRVRVEQLEEGGVSAGPSPELADLAQRVYRLEMTLFEQTQALNQKAQAFREEQQRQAELELEKKKQGDQGGQGES